MGNQLQPSGHVSFRTATISDLPALENLVGKYYAFDEISHDAGEVHAGLAILLTDATLGQAWLVLDARQPVGYVIFTYGFDVEFGGRLATITDLYLEPSHRGRGIGGKVLEHVEEYGRSTGLRGLELQVERDNAEARRLYEKSGFQSADRIPMSKRIKSS
jgi:ribosomal protein S18 acetylase RimI-like enzyme